MSDHAAEQEEEGAHGASAAEKASLPGLAAEQDGLRLDLLKAQGRTIRFRIVDEDDHPVERFDLEHEKRMHLIVVRRDLRGFQHLHPTMAQDGTWTATDADLTAPGVHRIYADFAIEGEKRTLGTDVHVPGAYEPRPLPEPATTDLLPGGIEVELERDGSHVSFSVKKDGRPADDQLQPYLGAKGHLVALRASDLAYLHTHPEGDALAFETELPSAGAYRLWVQFRLEGRVHTAGFTVEAQR